MSRVQRQRRSRNQSSPLLRVLLFALVAIVLAIGGGVVYGVSWVTSIANSAPPLSTLRPRIQGQVSQVFAANGQPLGYLSTDVLRTAIPQSQQPQLLRDATVAIEDRRFFHHGGVDYYGMARAAVTDAFDHSAGTQGGSTLTMQLVKNIYLPPTLTSSRSLRYKIVQAKYANELADRHSKDWILTQYLNDVPYGTVGGQSAYGVKAAAQMFFAQPNLYRLDLAQVALLAGLPQAPTDYNPFLHPALAEQRRSQVLAAMRTAGDITAAQESDADASGLQLKSGTAFYHQINQPYVFDYIRQQLIDKLGERTVDQGGLKVYTSINLQDQAYAKQALEDNEGEPDDPDAALVTVNPANGEIVAMAQNTTYGTGSGETQVNYATQALRQTGSAFKVFTLMAMIHDDDGDPNATNYVSKQLPAGWLPADPQWAVHNAESSDDVGVTSITKATALSLNTVYAQLGADVGLDNVMSMAYAMGITTKQRGPYYPDIIGGLNPGVTPLQMADAYATLANGGSHYTPTIIDRIQLPSGNSDNLLDTTPTRVFTDGEAYTGTQTLKTVLQYGTAAGETWGCPAAGKTGTTSNYTDAYFVGYTPKLSTAVWVGYTHEQESMQDVNGLGPGFGGTLAAPIWKDFMEKASDGYCGDFPEPTDPFVGSAYDGDHSVTGKDAYAGQYTTTYPEYTTGATGTGTTATGTATTPGVATATTPTTGGAAPPGAGTATAPPPSDPAPPTSGGSGIP